MNLIAASVSRPIAVLAAVTIVVLFGLVSLQRIPIQLTPDVNKPLLSVSTIWPGASPVEIEREIIVPQEERLASLPNLVQISSSAETGSASIALEFRVGADINQQIVLVSNALDQVSGYPDDVLRPKIETSSAEDNAIAWFIFIRKPGNDRAIESFGDFIEDQVKDRLARVPGVGQVNLFGASRQELQIIFDPERLAQASLSLTEVARIITSENVALSAGDIEEGKRRYVVRTQGELVSPELMRDVVLRSSSTAGGQQLARITLGDVATVRFGYSKAYARIRYLGQPALAMNLQRESGANVIETMRAVKEQVARLNDEVISPMGLVFEQVYDETVYIDSAIDLVQTNIIVGGILAALILLIFLRSLRATLIVTLAIPVSMIGSFVAMAALGRSLNVISLAGLAFAVGMVVDAAIVVTENIFRLREEGKDPRTAAILGAAQVWPALLVSALTTVLVFIPILVMELEVGQLFRDIAVAISVSVLLSLVVSITLIPALALALLRGKMLGASGGGRFDLLRWLGGTFSRLVMASLRLMVRLRFLALATVAGVMVLAFAVTDAFLPELEYLPEGNRNLVFGVVIPPPGYSLSTVTRIGQDIEQASQKIWAQNGYKGGIAGIPPIKHFFFVATPSRTFIGASSTDPQVAGRLIPPLQGPIFAEPGTVGFVSQPSLFGRGLGGGRRIDLDISGQSYENIIATAQRAVGPLLQAFPLDAGNQFRPNPGLELGAPEVRIIPDRARLADNAMTARELALTIDSYNDGIKIDDIFTGNRQIDVILQGASRTQERTQDIATLPVVTGRGTVLPVSSLAQIELSSGPTEVRHRGRLRTVTLELRPAEHIPLGRALAQVQEEVVDKLTQDGLPPGVSLQISGTADELSTTWDSMVVNLFLALFLVFLILTVLLNNPIYPLIIMISVPLAAAGGVIGLAVLNNFTFQPLDMLTLLGFVILIGVVVNNAILIVYQTLYLLHGEDMPISEAILSATRQRIRPIFMSSATSVFGMLPLVLFPGSGSELYRGLGSVVVGGLSCSAILTLVTVPPLLMLLVPIMERGRPWKATAPSAKDKKQLPPVPPLPPTAPSLGSAPGSAPQPAAG